jgi:hypothetical protein
MPSPPLFHGLPAGYPQSFTQAFAGQIRRKSTHFPHVLHMISMHLSSSLFPQLLRCDSEGNSRLGRKEKWRKRGVSLPAAEKEAGVVSAVVFGVAFS